MCTKTRQKINICCFSLHTLSCNFGSPPFDCWAIFLPAIKNAQFFLVLKLFLDSAILSNAYLTLLILSLLDWMKAQWVQEVSDYQAVSWILPVNLFFVSSHVYYFLTFTNWEICIKIYISLSLTTLENWQHWAHTWHLLKLNFCSCL